eukprot:GHUV01047994.1.p2 GENE.GHUV01047994.1~~GHUV01047994.1.p2  ORF type:complete len:110 (-),score=29.85 GHUV01047994.1:373-675(-)
MLASKHVHWQLMLHWPNLLHTAVQQQWMHHVMANYDSTRQDATVASAEDAFQWILVHAQAFEQPGNGRVLVVDGGGSKRCALLGDNIAEMAYKNGWSVSA